MTGASRFPQAQNAFCQPFPRRLLVSHHPLTKPPAAAMANSEQENGHEEAR